MNTENAQPGTVIPPRPRALPVISEGIPAELKFLDRWVTWSFIWYEDRQEWDQPPFLPDASGPVSAIDPYTWGSFPHVMATYLDGQCDGIGFVFNGDGIVGINLDNKNRNKNTDAQNQEAGSTFLRIADRMNSYTERSCSGTGFHILARGVVPNGRRQAGPFGVCETGRYFTVTGQSTFEKLTTLATNQDGLNWFYETYIAAP